MKVYQFDIRIVVPDGAIESTLLDKVRAVVHGLGGEPLPEADMELAQVKAVLVTVEHCGEDPVDQPTWVRQACDAIAKTDPTDMFSDSRMIGHDDEGAG